MLMGISSILNKLTSFCSMILLKEMTIQFIHHPRFFLKKKMFYLFYRYVLIYFLVFLLKVQKLSKITSFFIVLKFITCVKVGDEELGLYIIYFTKER